MTARPLEAIDGGRASDGWARLWASDRWPLRELPHNDLHGTVRAGSILFSGISQRWVKEAAKRWVRARLLVGGAPTTMANYVQHVGTFSAWLADRAPGVRSPAGVTRTVLEDWLLAVRASGLAMASKAARVTAVRLFLEEQWEDGLAGLPRNAMIHVGEVPHSRSRLPRGIEAPVFDQFVDPSNLALLPCEQHRAVILLLAFTGLRISSIVTLRRDALQIGSDNHPYLRYVNVKLRREAVIPIGPALVEQLRRQEDSLTGIYGADGTDFLLPSPPEGMQGPSRGGGHHITPLTARRIVKDYVRKAEIRDSQGRLAVWVHPHRFRHHLGTSLVNEGVPLSVIQRVLDHGSIEMTARYAHLDDETVKRDGAIDDRLDAGGGTVAHRERFDQRVGPVMPRRGGGRSEHSRHRAQLRGDLLGVAAVLDEHVERLHHARADVRVGELVATGDRGAAAGEVLQLRLVGVQLRAQAREHANDHQADRRDRDRPPKHDARPAPPGPVFGMAPVDQSPRHHPNVVDPLTENGEQRRQQGERREHGDGGNQHAADATVGLRARGDEGRRLECRRARDGLQAARWSDVRGWDQGHGGRHDENGREGRRRALLSVSSTNT